MLGIFHGYERRKERTGRIDFEDMLGLAVRMFDEHPATAAAVREHFHAFTVDEYQDVNPLQQALLDRWLGDRDELCVVGDDYQTIYSFTGASPEHLRTFAARFPHATVVRLEENHRSSPQILTVANALAGHMEGIREGAPFDGARRPLAHGATTPRRRGGGRVRGLGGTTPAGRQVVPRGTRSRSSCGSTPGPNRSRRRSRPPRIRTRSATAPSCVGRVLARCSRACDGSTRTTSSPPSKPSPTNSATPPRTSTKATRN